MKRMFLLQHVIFALFLIIFIPSCKKENINSPQCRIVRAWYSDTDPNPPYSVLYDVTYNDNGKPSIINALSGLDYFIKTITYEANTVTTITTDGSGGFGNKKIISYNSNNKISSIKSFFNAAGTSWSNTEMIYDNNGNLLKELSTNSNMPAPYIWTYTVSNGDITSLSSVGGTSLYKYYNDKQYQQGDYFWFLSLIAYGVEDYRKNAHLIKSSLIAGSSVPVQFNYEMDGKGLISKIIVGTITIEYQYDCN